MYFYSLNANPFFSIDPIYLKILYQFNILTVSAYIAFAINIYYKMAIKSDKKLYAAHQKTMTALKERDQLLDFSKIAYKEYTHFKGLYTLSEERDMLEYLPWIVQNRSWLW